MTDEFLNKCLFWICLTVLIILGLLAVNKFYFKPEPLKQMNHSGVIDSFIGTKRPIGFPMIQEKK